ncbi:Fur-regulated basic protein FbpA [Bacillus methanolicus]|uniref:Fur-regulated basic protein FbpA n=1 Tax=Bacillus methanolicus TaxID=1471 RepID=UPI0023806DD1|nr:Fur-regulated basic protein FbpA [Bacillus methanolicus]MDE3838973.1 Fur-regulated basic protein FbpA [Bacillus methanolicus]
MNLDRLKHLEEKKEKIIDFLILSGVYKKGNFQLFELSLRELEEEYEKLTKNKPRD